VKTALAGLLTLGLIGVFVVAIWAMFFNPGESKSSASTDRPTDNGGSPPTTPVAKTTEPSTATPIMKVPVDEPILPPGAKPDPRARIVVLPDNRKAYDIIAIPVGDQSVRFRLIDSSQAPRPTAPFYMMESKVWNGLFRAGKFNPPAVSEANGPEAPVTSVTVEEAMTFARSALGGKLPSAMEWDLGAGFYAKTGRNEVTNFGGSPSFLIPKPKPTNGPGAGNDINQLGLRDMAGNGREFTRTVLTSTGEREIDGLPPSAMDRIVLRGRNFTLSSPLTFEILRYEQSTPQAQYATVRSPYTSFRVAIGMP
jgi:hypothetical protein